MANQTASLLLCGVTLPSSFDTHVSYVPSSNLRDTLGLVWSCLFTISLCTWSLQHQVVPSPTDSDTKVLLRKLAWAAVTVISPEILMLIASEEWSVF